MSFQRSKKETDRNSSATQLGFPLKAYQDADQAIYFREVLNFLEQYRWVYDFQLTDFMLLRMWEKFPLEWQDCFLELETDELNEIPYGYGKEEWPESLKSFLKTSLKLSYDRTLDPDRKPVHLPSGMKKGMNPKKQHEVALLAGLVQSVSEQTGCEAVVDIGSGLGYLDQVLSQRCGLNVLGIESKEAYVQGATARAKGNGNTSPRFQSTAYNLQDTEESFHGFRVILRHWLEGIRPGFDEQEKGLSDLKEHRTAQPQRAEINQTGSKNCDTPGQNERQVCLVGLHCCGDLTPTMMRLFRTIPCVKSMVCLSCCYHRMKLHSDPDSGHFPMSKALKAVVADFQADRSEKWSLGTYAWRLAAQETRARWKVQTSEDHAYHMKNVAYRGLVECLSKTGEFKFSKSKRKVAHRHDYTDFRSYICTVLKRSNVKGRDDMDSVQQKLELLHEKYFPFFKYLEPFTCLQVVLQPVLETFLLVDRMSHLQEDHTVCTHLCPVFDESFSPRNIALVAWKQSEM